MTSLTDLLQQGATHAWLFIPSAILLGALHGLEPGHSKTMMAAFIVAVRGTVRQAVLLGLAATASHTVVVWIVALGGMWLFGGLNAEATEPYFQLASGVLIVVIALWMLWRTRREQNAAHDHDHPHHDEAHHVDTGHGVLALSIYETGVPPRFRVQVIDGAAPRGAEISVETERTDGARQLFRFAECDGVLESVEEIPEPHEFMARLSIRHDHHAHDYDVAFLEHDHGDDHLHEEVRGLDVTGPGYVDAHELAHANDIRRRFADRNVTTGQIVLFGLTGGLIPCPGAITVLLLCLQLKQLTLGAVLVLCFSIGLAITMVLSGVIAALSVKHISKRFSGFGELVRRAPYVSGGIILLVGVYVGVQGWLTLPHPL
ncbi:nickel/cobalt efflux transporter RcnA [Sphingobium fuliginis]|jgi:nickel/cobalt exporter|uniref:Nickel/cobalt efflux system n=1 Tax=Sphingobium fuliginis (strain ATCC 27551) TaxID=336203 RepID=A0A7M2GIA9_SPHSA|nr:nickel/cobalt efflux transporter [Sphingobium fuliginis]QOT72323.1 nickel/cobalt efflux transporter RcnA [Sphingobium fuliginis]